MPRKKKSTADLLTFDEDSPLFVKKTKTKTKKSKTEKSKPVKYESEAETTSKGEKPTEYVMKRKRKKQPPKSTNPNIPKYMIRGPSDCKHILSPAKKLITAKWILLEDGSAMEAIEVPNWLRGFANVIKTSRPKEYEELKILIFLAKQMAEERNKT